MIRKLGLAALSAAGLAAVSVSPAFAWGWVYHGPHGATVGHWGGYGHYGYYHGGYGYYHGCCYGSGAVAAGALAGAAVGTAVGVAAASRPVAYPPAVVYAPPPQPPGLNLIFPINIR